ncbi:MAG: cobalt transporter CbiM [Prochlorothrix sp.]|nr:cobalt transporter CbiM [Prochlorothrix sp.]
MHVADGLLPAPVCIGGYGVTGLITWAVLRQIDRRSNPSAEIPKASLLTAAFFVSSSLYIPIPPVSVHLVLNGLLGAILGLYAFPAVLIGLLFQALVFGHGGLSTLGVNALIMGVPALVAAQIFRWGIPDRPPNLPPPNLPQPNFPQPSFAQTNLPPPNSPQINISPPERPQPGLLQPNGSQANSNLAYRWKLGFWSFIAAACGVGLAVLFFFGVILTTIPLGVAGSQERQLLWGLLLAHGPVIVLEGLFTVLVVLFLDRVKPSLLPCSRRHG